MGIYNDLVEKQRSFFQSGKTKDVQFRIDSLEKLHSLIAENEQLIMDALKEDLNKSEFDSYITEIGIVLEEIRFMLKNIRKWSKPKRVKSSLALFGSKSYIYPEPYGVALIISPWNYPFQLSIAPMIGAIAAGNCVILKPSEFTPKTSELLAKLINENFPEEYLQVVEGDIETSTELLKEKTDYIFFTGSVSVGKKIMEAASKHLIPVTLELGGKSPCIVHKDANIKLAAKRVAWGKFLNAGQTCVAPDYVYVHHSVKESFLNHLKEAIIELYSDNIFESGTFTKIVTDRHFQRLIGFLDEGKIEIGGHYDVKHRWIEPTVVTDVGWDDKVMQEEIFGPILPILTYENLFEALEKINGRPKPLALYIFSESKQIQEHILNEVSFGGGCVNDTILHLSSPYLPFGGVGESGIGAYHGKNSFDTFSHEKSVLKQTTKFDIPYRYGKTENALKMIRKFMH